MEWIVPVLFVLATAAQWWLKRRSHPEELPPADPEKNNMPHRPVVDPDPMDDFGDLLEALGRRRHESPPPPVLPSAPPPLPPQAIPNQTKPPALPPFSPVPTAVQAKLPLVPPVPPKSTEIKPKTQPRALTGQALPRLRSHLREAVILSEILAPPLALR